MIVRSYHTSLPGEISRKWKSSSGIITNLFLNQVPTTRRVRHFTFTSILFTLLQQLGSISPSIQRIILHILQPLILSALYFISVILRDHPYSLIGVGIIFIVGFIYIISSIYKDRVELEEDKKHQENIRSNETSIPHINNLSSSSPSLSLSSSILSQIKSESPKNLKQIPEPFHFQESDSVVEFDDNNDNDQNQNQNHNDGCDDSHWSEEFTERNRRASSCEDISSFFRRDSFNHTTLSHRLRLSSIDSSNSDFLIKRCSSELYTDSSNQVIFPPENDDGNHQDFEYRHAVDNENKSVSTDENRRIDVNNFPILKRFSLEQLPITPTKKSSSKKNLFEDNQIGTTNEDDQTNFQSFWEAEE